MQESLASLAREAPMRARWSERASGHGQEKRHGSRRALRISLGPTSERSPGSATHNGGQVVRALEGSNRSKVIRGHGIARGMPILLAALLLVLASGMLVLDGTGTIEMKGLSLSLSIVAVAVYWLAVNRDSVARY